MTAVDLLQLIIFLAVALLAFLGVMAGFLARGARRGRRTLDASRGGDDLLSPPARTGATALDERPPVVEPPVAPTLERPEGVASRLVRLRQRLARSQGTLGRGLLALLSRERIDEDTWEEIEDTLITADIGVGPTQELVERLRTRLRVEGAAAAPVRDVLREELLTPIDPTLDRGLAVSRVAGQPAAVMVVGVNGTGKTTTVGKLARVLVAEDKHVVLGAA